MNLNDQTAPKIHPQSLQKCKEPTSPGDYPKVGSVVSIHVKSKGEVPATVIESSPDQIWLELARPVWPLPFRKGSQVRIKYWDEGAIAYFWEAKIAKADKSEVVELLLGDEGVTVQRRQSYRVQAQIRLSCTVIDSDSRYLVGEEFYCKTKDISVGGFAFDTNLPLLPGDRLAVRVHFSPSKTIDAVGWVLRSQAMERNGKLVNAVALQFLQYEAQDQNYLLRFIAYGGNLTEDA